MGLTIALETEDGEQLDQVFDPTNILHRVLPHLDDSGYECLKYIDWYGNTVFNELQMPRFLYEWESLEGENSVEWSNLNDAVRRLAERVMNDVHLYLKFYGD